MRIKQALIGMTTGLSLLVATQAGAVVINTTYDLNNGLFNITPLENGSVSITNGDHVELNVTFSINLALTIGDGNEEFRGWLSAGDNNSVFTIDNAVIEFLGFSGAGGASSLYNLGSQSSGAAHLGPFMSDFLSAGQSVSFTGYKVTYDVQSIAQSPHDYGYLLFGVGGDSASVGPAKSVPEPSSVALLLVGLASVFAWHRNKAA